MKATTLTKLERMVRPLATKLPPRTVVSTYSKGRRHILEKLKEDIPTETYSPPEDLSRTLWGIEFRSPIMNAAGMFKNGESYEIVSRQGAGAYLGGTGTWNSRQGNNGEGIYLPFTPYPISHSASNWLGLPNDGDEVNSARAENLFSSTYTPLGWSVMGSPDFNGEEKLDFLIRSMKLYEQAGVDFLEINESCPNTGYESLEGDELTKRLAIIKSNFLDKRTRNLPVIVKFSNDTDINDLSELLDTLFKLGYNGANFGNTSTDYENRRKKINPSERKLFDFFSSKFGGGVSGRPLRESSLELSARAVEHLRAGPPTQEFHIIRTGGIESWQDIQDSEDAGVPLNQWYTGYFEGFSKDGHDVYKNLFEK